MGSKTLFGWTGKILTVDLSQNKIKAEALPEEYMEQYIGGAGVNARLLYDLTRHHPQADALSPESPIISTGIEGPADVKFIPLSFTKARIFP